MDTEKIILGKNNKQVQGLDSQEDLKLFDKTRPDYLEEWKEKIFRKEVIR